MPKINREEYEILKALHDKWKWITRDKDRGLYAFTKKPVRKYDSSPYWDTETVEPYSAHDLIDEIHLFQFIQWEDEKPYEISELIEEYEEHEFVKINQAGRERLAKLYGNESEETEVKNVEWLKNDIVKNKDKAYQDWLEENEYEYDEGQFKGKHEAFQYVIELINQLDEPEVLSQEWIDKNSFITLTADDKPIKVVRTSTIEEILVPKQFRDEFNQVLKSLPISSDQLLEQFKQFVTSRGHQPLENSQELGITEEQAWEVIESKYGEGLLKINIGFVEHGGYIVIEKPTIPQFVADYFENFTGDRNDLFDYIMTYQWNEDAGYDVTLSDEQLTDWIFDSPEKVIMALQLAIGELVYEIEEEQQKYYVLNTEDELMLIKNVNNEIRTYRQYYHQARQVLSDLSHYQLTEQEIKDYDERYWPFAVKVEEMEE